MVTEVLDMVFEKKMNMVTKCVERIVGEFTNERQMKRTGLTYGEFDRLTTEVQEELVMVNECCMPLVIAVSACETRRRAFCSLVFQTAIQDTCLSICFQQQ